MKSLCSISLQIFKKKMQDLINNSLKDVMTAVPKDLDLYQYF